MNIASMKYLIGVTVIYQRYATQQEYEDRDCDFA